MQTQSKNITWHASRISKEQRRQQSKQHSGVLWFTGLSASGKSTLANALDEALCKRGLHSYVLDGDNVRHGLNKNLGFSDADRTENIRRIAEVAKLFVDAGIIVSTAFISPFTGDRQTARELLEDNEFIEVYVHCPLDICEERDPKGLYKKARAGEIKDFTGIDSAYQPPANPELTLNTAEHNLEACVEQILNLLTDKGWVKNV